MKELPQILDILNRPPAVAAVLATLVRVEGSSYRRPGARLLLTGDGRRVGSISGGCLEDDLLAHARFVLADGRPRTVTYDTTAENDLRWGVGMGCHGVVWLVIERLPPRPAWAAVLSENLRRRVPTTLAVVWNGPEGTPLGTQLAEDLGTLPAASIFRETLAPPPSLVIFGAGDDVKPLVRFAKEFGWSVTVVDPRPAYADPGRFPEADAVVVARPEEASARVAMGAGTLAVIMTHRYADDVPLLRTLLPRPLAYLGVLGSRKRTERILADLADEGLDVTPAMRRRFHAPVGLDLGADGPDEVALAILAEMKACLAGRDGRPLRERDKPIHEDAIASAR